MEISDPQIAAEVESLQSRGIEAATEYFQTDRERLRLFVMHRTDPRLLGRLDWDDVLQETYIVVQKRFRDFIQQPGVPFYVWMRSIAGQVLIDLHRRHLGAQKRSVGREISMHRKLPLHSTSASLASMLSAGGISPSGAAIRAEQLAQMEDVMDNLSDMDQEILALRHLEQMTNGEVAAALGIDKSAATKRYMRALKRIRELIDA